ncbi:MAG: hypothetical protein N3A69_05700 [Leptospiraceae bacterium]|nr:hypothetical protein [Leptospiraceae bacterium]
MQWQINVLKSLALYQSDKNAGFASLLIKIAYQLEYALQNSYFICVCCGKEFPAIEAILLPCSDLICQHCHEKVLKKDDLREKFV